MRAGIWAPVSLTATRNLAPISADALKLNPFISLDLRLTKDGNPNAGTTYSLGDGGPSAMDQRRVVDPSFLELVRLGGGAVDRADRFGAVADRLV